MKNCDSGQLDTIQIYDMRDRAVKGIYANSIWQTRNDVDAIVRDIHIYIVPLINTITYTSLKDMGNGEFTIFRG